MSLPLKRKRDLFTGGVNGNSSNSNSYAAEHSPSPSQQFASPKIQPFSPEVSEQQLKKPKIESSPLNIPPPQGNFVQPIVTPTTPATNTGFKSTADLKQEVLIQFFVVAFFKIFFEQDKI